jgi:ring-1,2-phenylacetyl-CoA epoxidase subunit PaaE
MDLQLRITDIIKETSDTRSFVLSVVEGENIVYESGQFLPLIFNKLNKQQVRRNYSLSSAPSVDNNLMVTIKLVENGEFSRQLVDKARVGDLLYAIQPAGFFLLPRAIVINQGFYFFAAGSGITPIFSLIKTLLYKNETSKVTLVYSNSSVEQTIFYQALNNLANQYPDRFTVIYFLSNSHLLLRKRLSAYSLEILLKELGVDKKNNGLFYLCGPFEYMQMVAITLLSNGINRASIKRELFDIVVPEKKPKPTDTSSHIVTILKQGFEQKLDVQYPQTILKAAKEKGIELPYSCESGQCGTCAVTCIKGKVFMWRNDVLMDDEIAKGRVLTCTGYPVDGDITIKV